MAENISFEDILSSLKKNTSTRNIGGYEFNELTLKQQCEILAAGFDGVEAPAKLTNIYNNYIKTCVKFEDSLVSLLDDTKLERRGFMLNILRQVSLGSKYYKDPEEDSNITERTCYTLYTVTEEDLQVVMEDKEITFGPNSEFTILLSTPTLSKDNHYNALLINALQPYSKKKDNSIIGPVADLYQIYEIMKFIKFASMNGVRFDFEQRTTNDKQKFLNLLPQNVIAEINDYIRDTKKHESKALEAVAETGDKINIGFDELFFIKAAKESE